MHEVTEARDSSVYVGTGRSPEGLGLRMMTQSQQGPQYCQIVQWAFVTFQERVLVVWVLVLIAKQK